MGETAGLIFLGGCGGQIYGQAFTASNATFKLLCNEMESFLVLLMKKPTSAFIQEMGFHRLIAYSLIP